ncbi:class I SAM-dependent methyltransferase [Candidatus Poribacteria bacterium]|nr:class I SAM-dependent methyltransferase [Candidatus Poribacteria bacterium]
MFAKVTAERTAAHSGAEKPIRERQLAAYYRALGYVEGRRVLEIGCGEGVGASILAQKAGSLVAVDYSEDALRQARSHCGACNTQFSLMKVPPIDFADASFDTVICFQMIEHLEKPGDLVAEICRIMRDDGIALIATVNKDATISPNPYHVREFSADEFQTFLRKYFASVAMYGVFGDELFMRYWRSNRAWVNSFMRVDIFNLTSRIPERLRKRLFDAASRLMRVSLRRRNPELCGGITHENFLFRHDEFDGCLDLFTVCRKTKSETEK